MAFLIFRKCQPWVLLRLFVNFSHILDLSSIKECNLPRSYITSLFYEINAEE